MASPVTTTHLATLKSQGNPIVMVTAYDATMARLADRAGVDVLLVGDSLGMVVQGHPTTLPVTLDQMVYHTAMVRRGAERPFIVADLPFGTFQVSVEAGVEAALRLVKEGGAHGVKLEGATGQVLEIVRMLTSHGTPVTGHVGLIPQSVHGLGGFRMQGRDEANARRILDDARALQDAGAHMIVLESIPSDLAATITGALAIPTIGIGAGPRCDGQVLVVNDLLGMDDEFCPSFVRQYASLAGTITDALSRYAGEVRAGAFPPSTQP